MSGLFKVYPLITIQHRRTNYPGQWVDVLFRSHEKELFSRDRLQVLGSFSVNGSRIINCLDGDPEYPEDRSDVLINLSEATAVARRQHIITGSSCDEAPVPIREIGTITYCAVEIGGES